MWSNQIISIGLVFIASMSATSFANMSMSSSKTCVADLISLDSISVQSTYDVFAQSTSPLIQTYQVRSDITGENCSMVVELDMDDGARVLRGATQQELRFDWYGGNGYQKSGRWYITLTTQEPNAQFQLRFPSAQWAYAGRFRGQISATFLADTLNASGQDKALFLDAEVEVLPSAKIQFYGLSQRHYDLDLGELTSHKVIQSGPNLWVQSTGEYAIAVESENRGNLRHESYDAQWDVAYQLLIENQSVPLATANMQWRSNKSTQGQVLPLAFVVGDVSQRPSGNYSDILHITIEPRLSQLP